MAMTVSLEQYEQAEREESMRVARVGLQVHAIVTMIVVSALVIVNIAVADEFPWSAFVALGMGLGLFFHWFGYRRAETDVPARQLRIEAQARTLTHL
jgi:type III secretory pathway component EscV